MFLAYIIVTTIKKHLIMRTQSLEQKVNFSINEVKNAMEKIFSKFNLEFLNVKRNDVFNTYSFDKIKCAYTVTLKEIDEKNTVVLVTCSDRSNDLSSYQALDASIMCYINEFLNILAAQLTGASDDEMTAVVEENSSNEHLGLILTIISIVASIAIFLI